MPSSTVRPTVIIDQLGDLPRLSETRHSRRARFHQAWYRVAVLEIDEWGATPSGRPLGSILPPPAAAAGLNFASTAARGLFTTRRRQGWGVDPVRMTSHMTSSQTLLVNLLGPLFQDRGWLTDVLRTVLERPGIDSVLDAEIEFAPAARSRYLGDMTRVDAFFRVRASGHVEGVVLELKYVDRFSTRRLKLGDKRPYLDLAESSALWKSPDVALTDQVTSQLLRCHALGVRTLQVEHEGMGPVTLLVVTHPLDHDAAQVVGCYRDHLQDGSRAVHVTLDGFVSAMAAASPSQGGQHLARELEFRYLDHWQSEDLWLEYLLTSNPRGGDAGRRAQER